MQAKNKDSPANTCTKCASLQSHSAPTAHLALKRQNVRQRFLDVFESYECLDCGAQWERIVFTEDKYPTRYLWKWKTAIMPTPLMLPAAGADLQHALASWIRPACEEQVQAQPFVTVT